MKRILTALMLVAIALTASAKKPKVYVTRDLSAESIVRIYHALGRPATGRVALKISTGESEKTGYIRPAMMKPLIDRIAQRRGTHIMEWGEKIGLGKRSYKLVSIDK